MDSQGGPARALAAPELADQDSDPFDTSSIRASVLASWRSSPTRLTEDATVEADLVEIGYRDRLATELVANAADAAVEADLDGGTVRVWLEAADDGHDLATIHVANTGAPLDIGGVVALSALRASPKASLSATVGRFGVGFTVVATVCDRVEIRSEYGGIEFDRDRTEIELDRAEVPVVDVLPPLLRLVWPAPTAPAAGFNTEVVLHVREDIDPAIVLAGFAADAVDLLLELPALTSLTVGDQSLERRETQDGATTFLDIGDRRWREYQAPYARWFAEIVDDKIVPVASDKLRAPTVTDVELTIPLRCVADLELTADRRGLHPDADIADIATGYADLALSLPVDQRLALVPAPGFPKNRYDERLREALIEELANEAWLPAAAGQLLIPDGAKALPDLSVELAELIGPVMGSLVHPDFSDHASLQVLGRLGVRRIGLADIAERLFGIDRDAAWWRRLYTAFANLGLDGDAVAELGALPVPRTDGRVIPGARGLAIIDAQLPAQVTWMQAVDPAAAHPFLERLGARKISVTDILTDPGLRAAIAASDTVDLAEQVLGIIGAHRQAGGMELTVPDWLGGLLIPSSAGLPTPADELLLPDGPLAQVLVKDSPFGAPHPQWVRHYGAEALRAVGVGWGFAVISEEFPTEPEHGLPDEEPWWSTLPEPPQQLDAVRDLDLVDPDKWPLALTILVKDPRIGPLLGDRAGYTSWWLRNHARIAGHALGWYRAPRDKSLAGLIDPLDHPQADWLTGALATIDIDSPEDARMVLGHLADPNRVITPAVAAAAHSALARAFGAEVFDERDVDAPEQVRTLAGVADARRAIVIDRPWLVSVVPADRAVVLAPPADPDDAVALADVLDIQCASEAFTAVPAAPGTATEWADHPDAVAAATLHQVPLPDGPVRLHDKLVVRISGDGPDREVKVPWWVDESGTTHISGKWAVVR